MPRRNEASLARDIRPVPASIRREPVGRDHKHEPPSEEAVMLGKRIAIHAHRKDWGRCHAILHAAECEIEIVPPTAETPLAMLLDARTVNKLETLGITTLGQLQATPDSVLLEVPMMGAKTLSMIRDAARKAMTD